MEHNEKLTQQLDEKILNHSFTKIIEETVTKEPCQCVLNYSLPLLKLKDGRAVTFETEQRWRLQARLFNHEGVMAPAIWKSFLGTLRNVAKAQDCIDNEDVITWRFSFCPLEMPKAGDVQDVDFITCVDGLGAYSTMIKAKFDAFECGATPTEPADMTFLMSFDRDGEDVLSIEHNFLGLRNLTFYINDFGDSPLEDPADAQPQRREPLESQPNLMVVAK
jgi:hypothetical protein